jgi:hypothetical protein
MYVIQKFNYFAFFIFAISFINVASFQFIQYNDDSTLKRFKEWWVWGLFTLVEIDCNVWDGKWLEGFFCDEIGDRRDNNWTLFNTPLGYYHKFFLLLKVALVKILPRIDNIIFNLPERYYSKFKFIPSHLKISKLHLFA